MNTEIPKYDGSTPPLAGATSYGYFDDDAKFVSDSKSILKSVTYKLGYPIMDVELTPEQIYNNFEEATIVYGNEVNKYNIKENLLNLKGGTTEQNLTQKNVSTSLEGYIQVSNEYGMEAGHGNLSIYKGFIVTEPDRQIYDLDKLYGEIYESGSTLQIRRIFHENTPAQVRSYSQLNSYGVGDGFGSQWLMTPIYDDLLSAQHIEFSDTVRRSAYSFRVTNNNLEVFPIPNSSFKMWFEYTLKEEKLDSGRNYPSGSTNMTDQISDYSNVPYELIPYGQINPVGSSWIREYTFALCQELLGKIRGKFQSGVPIPGDVINLDGDTLRSEGQTNREELLEQLRDTLESTSRRMQMESKQAEAEHLSEIMNYIPLGFYLG